MTYQIAILRHAYIPDLQGDETPRIYSDNQDNPIEYEAFDEAKSVIAEWDEEVYILSHNESGRPTYLVVKAVDGDYIHGGRNSDASNYDWSASDCSRNDGDACGECNDCNRLMINQDCQYLLDNAVYRS